MLTDKTNARLLTRGMHVISVIGSAPDPLNFKQVQIKSGLAKATLSRILSALRDEGYVSFDRSGRHYKLGVRLLDLMAHSEPERALRLSSNAEFQRLADELERPVWHWRVERDMIIPFEQIMPFGMITDKASRSPGRLDKTAAGIAVLSSMDRVRLVDTLEKFRQTEVPPENHVSLALGFSAATGFSTQMLGAAEQQDLGYSGQYSEIAAAIVDESGEPWSALTVLCSIDDAPDTERHQIGRKVAFTARRISSGPHIAPRKNDVAQRKPSLQKDAKSSNLVEILKRQPFDKVGSSPSWDATKGRLVWIDSLGGAINWCKPPARGSASTNYPFARFDVQDLPGAIVSHDGDRIIVASREGIAVTDIITGSKSVFSHPEPEDALRRFSAAQVGPDGRMWVASLRPVPVDGLGQGRIYALSANGKLERILDLERGIKGMCWSPDGAFLYITQSETKSILRFEMDTRTGLPENPRLFAHSAGEGTPNGLTIDKSGCVWAAIYGGWSVVRFNPQGRLIEKINLPVPLPTSLCFGGSSLQDLYITTCRLHVPPEILIDAPESGALFRLETQTAGVSGEVFKMT